MGSVFYKHQWGPQTNSNIIKYIKETNKLFVSFKWIILLRYLLKYLQINCWDFFESDLDVGSMYE